MEKHQKVIEKLSLRNGNVLVTVQEFEKKTSGGIIMISNEKVYKQVEVIREDSENNVNVGDQLYVPLHAGTPVEIDDVNYLVINLREIILVL